MVSTFIVEVYIYTGVNSLSLRLIADYYAFTLASRKNGCFGYTSFSVVILLQIFSL